MQFASVAPLIFDLSQKGQLQKIVWGPDQEKTFNTLKHLICSPVICVADLSPPFILQINASERGLRVVYSARSMRKEEHPMHGSIAETYLFVEILALFS